MFYSTQEAVAFGLKADGFDRLKLRDLRSMFLAKCDLVMEKELLDLAMVFATQAQFCREALEAREIVDAHPELFKDPGRPKGEIWRKKRR